MSKENGYNGDNHQWKAAAAGETLSGSWLVLRFAKDIPVFEPYNAPGSLGSFVF